MPRNVKESDDEVETKGGRRTRAALGSSVLDSPLRRSSRIKHPTTQDVSSPESVSDTSSVGGPRNTRRRTATVDSEISEAPPRNLRARRNSVASDISELTETESLPDGPPKRITRRSVAGVPSAETPTKLNGRTRRATRAGSETKSTPPVMGRTTRRTRASSMEPEISEEPIIRQVGTPVKSRKRASALPSEPAVAEESDDGKNTEVRKISEKTVSEMDEDDSETSLQAASTSLRENSKDDVNESDEKMEVDARPVKETGGDTTERSVQESTEAATDISGVSRKLEDSVKIVDSPDKNIAIDKTADLQKLSSPSKGSSYAIENVLNNSSEKQDKSPGNKENAVFNSDDGSIERNVKLANNEARLFHRKAFNATLAKIAEKRRSISSDDNYCETKISTKTQEIVNTEPARRSSETAVRKGYLVDECVVVIEPMDINQVDQAVVAQTSVITEPPKIDDDTIPKLDINPPLVQHEEQQVEASEKANKENNEDATSSETIVDGDSNLKISNVVSMAVNEEKVDKEDEAVEEKEANKIENRKEVEIIDLESNVGDEEEISLRTMIESDIAEEEEISLGTAMESNIADEEILLRNVIESDVAQEDGVPLKTIIESNIAKDEETSVKTANECVIVEETCAKQSNFTGETIDSQSSITKEKSQEIDENIVCDMVKGKSSIVTESPVSGTNVGEEASGSTEEQKNDKSASSEDSPEALGQKKLLEAVEADPLQKKNETEPSKVLESDNDSDCNGYPAFKDIPADEWAGADTERLKENNEDETNSLHSVSTERNESECDLELVDKEGSQSVEKYVEDRREAKLDYDTDETVIAPINPVTKATKGDAESEMEVINEETPMDLSSDFEEDEDGTSKLPRESSKKRLATPRKSNGANASSTNKNDSIIGSNSFKESTASVNVSRRKSLLDMDSDSTTIESPANEDANVSVKLSKSSKKSPKKRNSAAANQGKYDDSSDSEAETEIDESKSIKTANRKSAKKLDTSKIDVSAKNTPAKNETKASGTPAKRMSLNKFVPYNSEDSDDDALDNAEEQNKSQLSFELTYTADSPASSEIPLQDKEQHNKSVKSRSTRKSLSNRSASKVAAINSDSDIDDEYSLAKLDKSSKSEGGKVDRNNSCETQENLDSEIDENNSEQVLASPKIDEKKLNKSAKQRSAKKSTIDKNTSKIAPASSDSEIDAEDSKKAPVSSDSETGVDDSKKTPANPQFDLREKLNKSTSAKKLAIIKINSKFPLIDSDSEADEEELPRQITISAKKLLIDVDKNYSTIAQVNSDSEIMDSSSSDEDAKASSLIPPFFFDQDSTTSSNSNSVSEEDDSSGTIDSDVARDLNLHGKSVIEYSDDDVPADDCMATESESSDSDDDGADLLDFVVDDDDDEDDNFDDVAMELGVDKEETNDSSSSEKAVQKPRRRIISRPGGDSDSDESDEPRLSNNKSEIDKSTPAKTPKNDKNLNKSEEVLEPEIQSIDLNLSSKALAKRNKNLLIQSSTPKGRGRLSLENVDAPKSATPLSKSPKQADLSTKIEAVQISSGKKLSKSVCETVDTPTKISSSFKVKTTKTPVTVADQLQTSLPTDLADSTSKTNLSKTKSTKISTLHRASMTTPDSESPETRFLMKEKLNETLPALKLQQRAKASRRSTLDNLREEVASPDEQSAAIEEQAEHAAEKNVSIREVAAAVESKVDTSEKKKKKKKAAKNTSTGPEDESLATSKETESILKENDITERPENDSSHKISKKRNKKKKIAEMETTQEPVESITEEMPSKDKKKKKKREENIEEVQINETSKDKKKKKQRDEIVDEVQTSELSVKDKKKKKRDEIVDEIQTTEINAKDKKKKKQVETVDEIETTELTKKDKKKKKRDEIIDEIETSVLTKKDKKRKRLQTSETAETPISKKKSLRLAEESVGSDDAITEARALKDQMKLTENIKVAQDPKKKKQELQSTTNTREQRKIKTRSEAANADEASKTNLKRLPDEILESLSDTAERPKKRRKIAKGENIVPSKKMVGSHHQSTSSLQTDEGSISLSVAGGTTQFDVVNLNKATKKSKKAVAAGSFRERMLARNPRQPISAYLMYQQKQKASGKDRPY